MNIHQIYKAVEFFLNKDQFGGNFPASKFNAQIPLVEIDLWKQRYGIPQEYQPGMPLPRMSYEITQKIADDTSPFKVWMGSPTGPAPMQINAYGIATKPTDYVHASSCRTMEGYPVEILSDAEYNERGVNPNRTPSFTRPVLAIYSDYLLFAPKTLIMVNFVYLRLPIPAQLAVTVDPVTDVETYDATNSVQTEFPVDMHTEYIRRMCLNFGVNIRSETIVQYANAPEK